MPKLIEIESETETGTIKITLDDKTKEIVILCTDEYGENTAVDLTQSEAREVAFSILAALPETDVSHVYPDDWPDVSLRGKAIKG